MGFAPAEIGRFEFVRLSALRTAQLIRGCPSRVTAGRKHTTTAQREIAERKVCAQARGPAGSATLEDPAGLAQQVTHRTAS